MSVLFHLLCSVFCAVLVSGCLRSAARLPNGFDFTSQDCKIPTSSELLFITPRNTMICRRCHQRLLAQRHATPSMGQCSRQLSQASALRAQPVTAQTTQATNPRPHDKPAAISTSAAQPFSTPLTPAQGVSDLPESGKQAGKVQSSVPAGTVLKGLNFMKNKQDPVALEDHEYPPWLWTVLNQKGDAASSNSGDAEGDLFCT